MERLEFGMRGRILIVEDEPAIRNGLKVRLEAGGFEVATANNGRDGVAAFCASPADLVIMDVMMPVMNGFEACKAIREQDKATPIVFLSCRDGDEDRILALDLGAVEFVRKEDIDTPRMSMEYFMSLMDRHIRRVRELSGFGEQGTGNRERKRGEPKTFKIGEMEIDVHGLVARGGGEEVAITASEADMLQVLDRNRGRCVGYDGLIDALRGEGFAIDPHAMVQIICRVKRKLGASGDKIRNIRTRGYILDD